jgi:hypothetical protein
LVLGAQGDATPKLTLTLDPLFGPNLSPILFFNPNPLSKLTRGFPWASFHLGPPLWSLGPTGGLPDRWVFVFRHFFRFHCVGHPHKPTLT